MGFPDYSRKQKVRDSTLREADPRYWQEQGRAAGFSPFSLVCPEREVVGLYRPSHHEPESAPGIYLSAGIHGDEPAGVTALSTMVREDQLSPEVNWFLFPCLNPGGFLCRTRENPEGIDLNRDYLRQQSWECRLHARWMREHSDRIQFYLSLHEDWETGGCYLYEIFTGLPAAAPSRLGLDLLDQVGRVIPIESNTLIDGHQVDAPGLIRHQPEPDEEEGWPEAIFACKQSTLLSYTFETPSRLPLEQREAAHREFVLTAQEWLPQLPYREW